VQAMVDKITAQRDVEYFYELLAKETDENRRVILQRLLADAEKRRQAEDQEENSNKKTNADQADRKDN
jgi:phage-related minor tail protein